VHTIPSANPYLRWPATNFSFTSGVEAIAVRPGSDAEIHHSFHVAVCENHAYGTTERGKIGEESSSILDSKARLRERHAGTPQRTNATSDNYMDSMGKTTRRRSRSIVASTRNPSVATPNDENTPSGGDEDDERLSE
jgi:hypothetical protein